MSEKLSTWWRQYRVIHWKWDDYHWYASYVRYIWFPFWLEINVSKHSSTYEEAVKVCRRHKNKKIGDNWL